MKKQREIRLHLRLDGLVNIRVEGDLDRYATDYLEEFGVRSDDLPTRLTAMLDEMDTWT